LVKLTTVQSVHVCEYHSETDHLVKLMYANKKFQNYNMDKKYFWPWVRQKAYTCQKEQNPWMKNVGKLYSLELKI
jgi:hypothetical protein